MPAMTLSPITILLGALTAFLAASVALQFSHREAIPLVFGIAMIVLYAYRDIFIAGFPSETMSRDMKILALLVLFTVVSLHIYTFEVLWGLGKAAVSAANLAGYRLGHAVAGLF